MTSAPPPAPRWRWALPWIIAGVTTVATIVGALVQIDAHIEKPAHDGADNRIDGLETKLAVQLERWAREEDRWVRQDERWAEQKAANKAMSDGINELLRR